MPKLTDRLLAGLNLELGRKDRLLFDTECRGLGVRLTLRTGRGAKAKPEMIRTFIVQWRDPATRKTLREPVGVWGGITIEQAREAVRARLGAMAKGINPRAERAKLRAEAERERAERALTFGTLIEGWGALYLNHRRTRYSAEAQRALRYAFPSALNRPAARLTRAEVVNTLDALAKAGKAAMAGRTMAYGRACYRWAELRGKVPGNPFASLPISAGATERERVLTDEEIGRVWKATTSMPYPWGPLFRLLFLTLARREEVAGMRWSELSPDLGTWTIPSTRMKRGLPHLVALPAEARDVCADSANRRTGLGFLHHRAHGSFRFHQVESRTRPGEWRIRLAAARHPAHGCFGTCSHGRRFHRSRQAAGVSAEQAARCSTCVSAPRLRARARPCVGVMGSTCAGMRRRARTREERGAAARVVQFGRQQPVRFGGRCRESGRDQ